MTQTISMSALYRKLSRLGLPKKYIRDNALPSWWDEELETKPVAILEGAGYIAKRLGLDLKSLLAEDEPPRFKPQPQIKFKQRPIKNNHPEIAQGLAHRLAEMVAYGTEVKFTPLPSDANQIREQILTLSPTINLTVLLDYCWQQGIAVVHFHHFPQNTKKMDGMIQSHLNRPVIVISANYKPSARLAFILAHELGHLALGHLTEGILIDEEIDVDSPDEEEHLANQFAVNLLLGDCDNCLGDKQFHNHNHLLKYAKDKAQENPSISPDSIVLNYAWHNNNWGLANKALKKLYPSANGQEIINQYLAERLDWDKFDDDSYEYLEKVLGV
jgi:hypothetical protein